MTTALAFDEAMQPSLSERALYRKLRWKILPIIFILFVFSFLDRVNIGYAHLQLKSALVMSDAQFGWAAGIFSIAYLIFEFPMTMLFPRMGARKTFLRIAVLWGLTSGLTAFVTTPTQLYVLRFVLGAFEAGVLPAVVLHLNNWFPHSQRGRVTGIFMLATGVASVIGGPISGWIMTAMDGSHGLAGWQWLFLVEGLPTVLVGVAAYLMLVDRPADATWMNASEKQMLQQAIRREQEASEGSHKGWLQVLKDWRVLVLALLLFAVTCGGYAISFWLPSIIRRLGVASALDVGLWAVIPAVFGCLGFVLVGLSSDRLKERRWHYAVGALAAGGAFCLAFTASGSLIGSIGLLSVANFAVSGCISVFWTIPPSYFGKDIAPAGVAIVNIGNVLAGLLSPLVIGALSARTGSLYAGLTVVGADLLIAAVLMLLVLPAAVSGVPGRRLAR